MGERRPQISDATDITGRNAVETAFVRESAGFPWRQVAVAAWLVFLVALASWWWIFGLQQIDRLSALSSGELSTIAPRLAQELAHQHRMLMSEGLSLVILLIGGGIALLYYVHSEMRRARQVQDFFAAFTHDLKTSLSSLRLQAESLEEDLKDSGESRIARRLVKDTVRLELQLENSLLLAAPASDTKLLLEPLRLVSLLQSTRHQWPDLELVIEGEAVAFADSRAVESIFKNILQNAIVHGRASKVLVDMKLEGKWVRVRFNDNGRGFKGDIKQLGHMFRRHSTTSGSGLGLYLAIDLSRRMGGDLMIIDSAEGFVVEVMLPAAGEN